MNFLRKFLKISASDEVVLIPSGKLFLTRSPQSPKGELECLYNDAFASIRQTAIALSYKLVITRVYQEGELTAEDDGGYESSDGEQSDDFLELDSVGERLGRNCSKDEYGFIISEELKFFYYEKSDGSRAISWKDIQGDPGDSFEFVIDDSAKQTEVDSFMLTLYKCQYEQKYHRSSNEISSPKELKEFVYNPRSTLSMDLEDLKKEIGTYEANNNGNHHRVGQNHRQTSHSVPLLLRSSNASLLGLQNVRNNNLLNFKNMKYLTNRLDYLNGRRSFDDDSELLLEKLKRDSDRSLEKDAKRKELDIEEFKRRRDDEERSKLEGNRLNTDELNAKNVEKGVPLINIKKEAETSDIKKEIDPVRVKIEPLKNEESSSTKSSIRVKMENENEHIFEQENPQKKPLHGSRTTQIPQKHQSHSIPANATVQSAKKEPLDGSFLKDKTQNTIPSSANTDPTNILAQKPQVTQITSFSSDESDPEDEDIFFDARLAPERDSIYEQKDVSLFLFDADLETFKIAAKSPRVGVDIIDLGNWKYQLAVQAIDLNGKPLRLVLPLLRNLDPTFNFDRNSFIFTQTTERCTFTWLIKFEAPLDLTEFQIAYLTHLWQAINKQKYGVKLRAEESRAKSEFADSATDRSENNSVEYIQNALSQTKIQSSTMT